MRFRTLVTAAARLALGAVVLAGGLTAATPASAATPGSCGTNQVCLFTGKTGSGAKLVVTGDRATLGSFDLAVSSVTVHTGMTVCAYPRQNFETAAPLGYMILTPGSWALPFLDEWDNRIRSVELVPSSLDCGLPYTHPTWAGVPVRRSVTGPGTAFGDLNRDGYADLMLRDKTGGLWSLSGAPGGPARRLGGGWGSYSLFARHGDLNGDSREDFLARDAAGVLWLYPGRGDGSFGARVRVGAGWAYTRLYAMGDLNGDGRADLYAVDAAGRLWLYLGRGDGTFQTRRQIGTGWTGFNTLVPVGDATGDGRADLFARDRSNHAWIYPGRGDGTVSFGARRAVAGSWARAPYAVLGSVGDVTGDGLPDLTAFAGTRGDGTNYGMLRTLTGRAGGGFPDQAGPGMFGLRTTSPTF